MEESARSLFRDLGEVFDQFGAGSAADKLALLSQLRQRPLASASEVMALHEMLCFLRAYPDDRGVLAQVESMLDAFAQRADLQRFRSALADSGIAGCDTHYRFFWPTAARLARRWPDRLQIDWSEWDNQRWLTEVLPLLVPFSETLGLDELDLQPHEWLSALAAEGASDAAFLLHRVGTMAGDDFVRERTYDLLDVPLRLAAGDDTPARGREKLPVLDVVFQTENLDRARPDLSHAVHEPPSSIRTLSKPEARRAIALARNAMVARNRDLDGFAYADPDDARMVDCGGGYEFVLLGLQPERRLMLESSYALLTLKNGVPIGYVLISALFGCGAIAYNVFDTFRGAEAGHVFGRVLAVARHVFGVDAFSIDPFQLGHGNAEGLASGAWWFYYKLGFRPRDRDIARLARGELAKIRRDQTYRSNRATLEQLASDTLYLHLGPPRDDVFGVLPLGEIGLALSRWLARNYGADRERALRECSAAAAKLLDTDLSDGLTRGQKLWWSRWSPLVCALPEVARWSVARRHELGAVVLAKGGRHESDFVRLFDAHKPLRRAILSLAQ